MSGPVSQAVARRDAGVVKIMWAEVRHFAVILPDHIDAKSFLGTAAAALYANADLMKCAQHNPESLMTALYRCAALGHQPGTDEFYLTPRGLKGGKRGPEVLGIEGYRGVVERMYRSGAVASVIVREVCAKDKFRYIEGVTDRPQHNFSGADTHDAGATGADFFGTKGSVDRGPMVGVYAYAILATGAVSRVVILSRDDVMAARDASDAKDSPFSPWNRFDAGKDHPEFQGRSMWWKTAARRLEPWVPTSAEYRREQIRAAAQAAAVTAPPGAPPPQDIHDAEIVDEPSPVSPAGEKAAATPPDAGMAAPAGGGSPAPAAPEPQAGAGPSKGLVGVIRQHFKRLGYDDSDPAQKEERLVFTARLAGRDAVISTTGDLTREQAQAVADLLGRCPDRAALVALIADGAVPS